MKEKMGRLLRRVLPRLLPNPPPTREVEASLLFPPSGADFEPSEFLLDLASNAIRNARVADLRELDLRWEQTKLRTGFSLELRPSNWPGEHYRILAGLTMALKPRHIVEIGTGGGLSALSMKKYLPQGSRITTFDIVPWNAGRPFEVLRPGDFEDGRLIQLVGDLSNPATFARHKAVLKSADMIFIDGPKDGSMEGRLLDLFDRISFDSGTALIVLDDVRLWNMLGIWWSIRRPKMDLTSFGHWCGTGLVDWR